MSKAIMISIRPKWVAKIIRGDKTLEIRKTCPKQLRGDTSTVPEPIEVYIYCCKPKHGEIGCHINFKRVEGKVIGKFTLNKITPTYHFYEEELCALSCVSKEELFKYLGYGDGYAWHIDNLVIFDKPRELSEFKVRSHKVNGIGLNGEPQKFEILKPLNKAPESYCFVEKEN